MIPSLASFVLGLIAQVDAAPSQAVFGISNTTPSSAVEDDHHNQMRDLLDRYAPVFKLSKEEEWFPSSIEYILPHYAFDEDARGHRLPLDDSLLTPSRLDELPPDTWLSLEEEHNAQPDLPPDSDYLHGPYWNFTQTENNSTGVAAPVYGFYVERARGVVDLWYWTHYPYNFGKHVGNFGVLGNHVSDWERLVVRTINGSIMSVDFNVHNGGSKNAGTIRWIDAPKVNGRPAAYVAAGSHGVWPTPGIHVYEELLDVFQLADVTDDEGPLWDTKGRVEAYKFWDGKRRHGMIHSGEESWLNYKGRWGNHGVYNCWWHRMIPYCQIVDSPPGPNRDVMLDPPQCVVAPLARSRSSYSFYLSPSVVDFAIGAKVKEVKVEQICAAPKRRKHVQGEREGVMLYMEERMDEEEYVWSSKTGNTPFAGSAEHTAVTPPCNGHRAAVRAYRISLCRADGKCIATSPKRSICTYEEGKEGYQFGNAVAVEDVDDWYWDA